MPRRMFGIARDALMNGFLVTIDQHVSGEGWRMTLRDEHHCLHISYVPSSTAKRARYGPWTHTRNGLWGNCAAQEHRIDVRPGDIKSWLETHPNACKGGAYAAALEATHRCHCKTFETVTDDQHAS